MENENKITYDPYTESGLPARTEAADAELKASGSWGLAGVQDLGFGYNQVAAELRNMNAVPHFISEIPPEFVVEGSIETGYETRWLTSAERETEHIARVASNDLEFTRYQHHIQEAEARLRSEIEWAARAGGGMDWQGQNEAIAQDQRQAEQLPAYQHAKPMMTPVEGFLLSFFVGLLLAIWGFGGLGILPVAVLSVLIALIGTGLLFFSGAFAGMRL